MEDVREAIELKNVPNSGKSPKGGGDQLQIKKCGLFDERAGGNILIFLPNVNAHFKYFSSTKK